MNCESSHIWMQIFEWKLIISSLKDIGRVSPPHRGNPMNKCHNQNNNQLTSRPSLYCISSQLVGRSSAWCDKQTNVTSEKQSVKPFLQRSIIYQWVLIWSMKTKIMIQNGIKEYLRIKLTSRWKFSRSEKNWSKINHHLSNRFRS